MFLGFLTFLIPNVLFCQMSQEKNLSLNVYGFIFALFPVGLFITSHFLGKNMERLGRKYILNLGNQILTLSMILFGISDCFNSPIIFVIIGSLARFFQGVGVSMINIICYGLLPIYFPLEIGLCISYFELVMGVGQGLGANVGEFLEKSFQSEQLAFFIVAIFYYFVTRSLFWYFPQDQQQQSNNEKVQNQLTYQEFLKCPKFLIINITITVTMLGNVYLLSGIIFGYHEFTNNINHISYLLGLYSIFYGLSMYGITLIQAKISNSNLMTYGYLLQVFIFFFVESSPQFLIGHSIANLYIGFIFSGIGNAMTFQPCMQQMIDAARVSQTKKLGLITKQIDNQITDLCSGCFIIFISLGQFLGPICATQLLSVYDWSISSKYIQFIILIQGIIFYSLYKEEITVFQNKNQQNLKQNLIEII